MPLRNFGIVMNDDGTVAFFRVAQPDRKGFEDLKLLGATITYKLNTDSEFPAAREAKYMAPGEVQLDPSIGVWSPDLRNVMRAAQQIKDLVDAGAKVVLHCTHGRDRTGLVAGAYRLMFSKATLAEVEEELHVYGVEGLIALGDLGIIDCLKAVAKKLNKE